MERLKERLIVATRALDTLKELSGISAPVDVLTLWLDSIDGRLRETKALQSL